LAGCSGGADFVAKDEPWRKDVEIACLQSGAVRESAFVSSRSSLGGPRPCGAVHPFEVSALGAGAVELKPAATLQCGMIPALERWSREVANPAAHMYFGMGIARLKVAASYACRPMNHVRGGKLSEHGHANAIDISAFELVDGRVVTVKAGWHGTEAERAFLRSVHRGACGHFTTVLGPAADRYHRDHFHFDLARHGRRGDRRICQ
jgi:hypothetical protein